MLTLPKMPNLPHFFEKKDSSQEEREFFWALLIWEDSVKSSIWAVEEGKTKVISFGSWQEWDGVNIESLLKATDQSFASVSQSIEETWEPDKVVLGLPESWTEGEKIKTERQEILQKVCQKLELKPVGFVSIFDALTFQLKRVEGMPLSAILVRPGKEKILVAVSQVGKILKVEEVVRSEDIAADTCEGLLRFEVENLPSRILLFDNGDLEEERQKLTAFHWEATRGNGEKLPFLHFPKIEVLPSDFDINAVSLAGGTEVAKSLGFEVEKQVEGEEKKLEEENLPFPQTVLEPEIAQADLGFVNGEDVSSKEPRFPEEENLTSQPLPLEQEVEAVESPPVKSPISETPPRKSLLLRLKLRLPTFSLSRPKFSAFIAVGLVSLFLIGTGFFWLIWSYPKAEIILFVAPKSLEKEITVVVDPTLDVPSEAEFILPGIFVEKEISGDSQQETTGEKTVGEKTKGEVTLYNRTSSPETFAKGTFIVGPSSLKFTLDEEVRVASKTPDLDSGVDKWGEATVGITGNDIGANYNLAADSQFSIANFPSSSFLAKNKNALSGGTSRQIQAVSEEDQKELLKTLDGKLKEEGKLALQEDLNQDQKLIEASLAMKIKSKNFDHEVGEEAKTLTLSLTSQVSALSFRQDDFLKIALAAAKNEVPENYELKSDQIDQRFEKGEEKEGGAYSFTVYLKANLLPKIEGEELISKIKGKRPSVAKQYLTTLAGFTGSEILLKPKWLPSFLQFLPRTKEKIEVTIEGQ